MADTTFQDSFTSFHNEILTQDSGKGSFDVDSLFTNFPSYEIIDICVNKLFQNYETLVNGISKNDFHPLLNLATTDSFFFFL